MIVAVTGSSGFIGKRLVRVLQDAGHEVVKLDIAGGFDILNWEAFKKVPPVDVLVHLAARSFVPDSYDNPHDFYHLNINGVINGLEFCRMHKARFVFASSYVYGKPAYLPIDENHPLQGFNPYAETKIIGEKICRDYHKYFQVPSIILRPFNIYGPGQNENFLIPSVLKQAKTGIVRLMDPRPKRDFIFVDDVVRAFHLAVENKEITFDCFNVGSGKSYSVKEVTEIVNRIYHHSLRVEFGEEERMNEVLDTVAEISKTRAQLHWKPIVDLTTGLKTIIDI